MEQQVLYFDYQASTPTDPRVVEKILPWFSRYFANPHAIDHQPGQFAQQAIENARQQIAGLIGAEPREIIFTSGATESNNLAILGGMRGMGGRKRHLITWVTEHKCVLESARQLEKEGFQVTFLPVQADGLINLQDLKQAIQPDTGMVSLMMVNNEIGVIQDVDKIGQICRQQGILFHCDAAQAVGKLEISVNPMNMDLLSISGHKIYGPKGIGALYIRHRPRVRLQPLFYGGGQERGMRSGTLPTPLCVGLGAACEIAQQEMKQDANHIKSLQQQLWRELKNVFPSIRLNGHEHQRYGGNLNVCFTHLAGKKVLNMLPQLAVSSGSACSASDIEPSYVLQALGLPKDLAQASIRFSLGRFSRAEDIQQAIDYLKNRLL
ncbi:MAG TPA: aminotransferase class V-fold PLP-dependent enzyme [Alphaproteobacteria bacterium]|nr:aminotransferase class V-fold PLP-dependent enzyme [Alphaproteobacteria bacterium]